jgi:hypothetical protein
VGRVLTESKHAQYSETARNWQVPDRSLYRCAGLRDPTNKQGLQFDARGVRLWGRSVLDVACPSGRRNNDGQKDDHLEPNRIIRAASLSTHSYLLLVTLLGATRVGTKGEKEEPRTDQIWAHLAKYRTAR